jgi:hypothetical protein
VHERERESILIQPLETISHWTKEICKNISSSYKKLVSFTQLNNKIHYARALCFGLTAIIRLEISGSCSGEEVDCGHLGCDAIGLVVNLEDHN